MTKTAQAEEPKPCPNCGRCPTCGTAPARETYVYPWRGPLPWKTTWGSGTTNQSAASTYGPGQYTVKS